MTQHHELLTDGRIIVVVHGEAPWTDEQNAALIAVMDEAIARYEDGARMFVYAAAGRGPNTTQRMKFSRFRTLPGQAVAVTDSVIARGIVTALNWMQNGRIGAYSTTKATEAVDALELRPEERQSMVALIRGATGRVGVKDLPL